MWSLSFSTVVLRIVVFAGILLFVGCSLYVVVSYTHAFYHRRLVTPVKNLVRGAFTEIGTCMLLLPFWPLWMLVGASYEAALEGPGRRAKPESGGGHPTGSSNTRRPVVLWHGLAMNRTNWIWLGRSLARRGIGPLYGASYFSPQSVARSAEKLKRIVDAVCAKHNCERIDIVAHSLGGVVARYYIARLGGADKVGKLVTIGSPHRGTITSRFAPLIPSVEEQRIESRFLQELGPLIAHKGIRYTSVWSRADAVVEPPESASIAPVGEDCVFEDIGHLALLLSRRVRDAVAERLLAP
jgi:pimeloyl-ACP methyl ester carboxylesterase